MKPMPPQFRDRISKVQNKKMAKSNLTKPAKYNKADHPKLNALKYAIKKGRLNGKNVDWFIAQIGSPRIMAIEIMNYVENVKKEEMSVGQKLVYADLKIKLMKAIHGDKIKIESVSINMDMKMDDDEVKRLMGFIRGDK